MLTTGRALTWSMDSTAVVHRDSMGTDVKNVFTFYHTKCEKKRIYLVKQNWSTFKNIWFVGQACYTLA